MRQSFVRFLLFLLAYIPIYLIAAIKSLDIRLIDTKGYAYNLRDILLNNILSILLLFLIVLLIIYFKSYFRLAIKPKGNPIFAIKSFKQQHKEYVTYLGTYILPFVAFKSQSFLDIISIIVMFLTIGYIYSKSNLIYTNPTLTFFGFDIYEVEDENNNKYDCITKDKFTVGDKPIGIKLGENTYIISKWKSEIL